MPRQVQLHMGAIQQILDICQRKSVYLSDGIKRAIFWQVTMRLPFACYSDNLHQVRPELLGYVGVKPSC
jgi:hypothetical protein